MGGFDRGPRQDGPPMGGFDRGSRDSSAPAEGFVPFQVNWGERHGADPRRVLAMVCRKGGIRGNEVGAIRIGDAQSSFEVASSVAASFAQNVKKPDPRDPRIRIEPSAGSNQVFETSMPPVLGVVGPEPRHVSEPPPPPQHVSEPPRHVGEAPPQHVSEAPPPRHVSEPPPRAEGAPPPPAFPRPNKKFEPRDARPRHDGPPGKSFEPRGFAPRGKKFEPRPRHDGPPARTGAPPAPGFQRPDKKHGPPPPRAPQPPPAPIAAATDPSAPPKRRRVVEQGGQSTPRRPAKRT